MRSRFSASATSMRSASPRVPTSEKACSRWSVGEVLAGGEELALVARAALRVEAAPGRVDLQEGVLDEMAVGHDWDASGRIVAVLRRARRSSAPRCSPLLPALGAQAATASAQRRAGGRPRLLAAAARPTPATRRPTPTGRPACSTALDERRGPVARPHRRDAGPLRPGAGAARHQRRARAPRSPPTRPTTRRSWPSTPREAAASSRAGSSRPRAGGDGARRHRPRPARRVDPRRRGLRRRPRPQPARGRGRRRPRRACADRLAGLGGDGRRAGARAGGPRAARRRRPADRPDGRRAARRAASPRGATASCCSSCSRRPRVRAPQLLPSGALGLPGGPAR